MNDEVQMLKGDGMGVELVMHELVASHVLRLVYDTAALRGWQALRTEAWGIRATSWKSGAVRLC